MLTHKLALACLLACLHKQAQKTRSTFATSTPHPKFSVPWYTPFSPSKLPVAKREAANSIPLSPSLSSTLCVSSLCPTWPVTKRGAVTSAALFFPRPPSPLPQHPEHPQILCTPLSLCQPCQFTRFGAVSTAAAPSPSPYPVHPFLSAHLASYQVWGNDSRPSSLCLPFPHPHPHPKYPVRPLLSAHLASSVGQRLSPLPYPHPSPHSLFPVQNFFSFLTSTSRRCGGWGWGTAQWIGGWGQTVRHK